ncbi:MAG: cob(I)yrinic acid a,c-diamide adenosyltransferase [Patescibacteria group bacterium]|jgi:cob(I)alamin adenosyltransferase
MKSQLGKIHIYTGDGKGKTTAALGLALRAIGAGYQVYLVQFLKAQQYSELDSLKRLPEVTIKRFGQKTYIYQKGTAQDKILAKRALNWAKKIFKSGKFDLVILDEIFLALFFKLISVKEIVQLMKSKPAGVELVLTGRRAPKELIKLADYVTEMKEIKHPYQAGLLARKGIED